MKHIGSPFRNQTIIHILLLFLAIGQSTQKKFRIKRSTNNAENVTNEAGDSDPCILEFSELDSEEDYEEQTASDWVLTSTLTSTSTLTLNSTLNSTSTFVNDTLPDEFLNRFSTEFLSCLAAIITPECYEKRENDTVYVPRYSRTFDRANHYIAPNNELRVCADFFVKGSGKFADWMSVVSNIGVGVSFVCIVLHVFMFLMIPKLRNLPGYCLVSQCVSLMVAYTCFFIPLLIHKDAACAGVGMTMYFSFLASVFWMNTMSYDVWRSLRLATAKLRLTVDRPMMVRFGLYSLYSWGTPLLILVIALIIDSATHAENKYSLIFDQNTCWFQYKPALGMYFALPIFTVLFVNIGFFVHSSIMISSASMKNSDNKVFLWSRFVVSLRLAVVMGLAYIFGALAVASDAQWLWYIYSFFTAMQGVFIFFSFTLTDKTKKACKMALQGRKSCPSLSHQVTTF